MLTAYFDESGEHDRITGHEIQTSVGGCLADAQAWQEFSKEWIAALPAGGTFHMKEFVQRNDTFAVWTDDDRTELLNKLYGLIAKYSIQLFGFTCQFEDECRIHRKKGKPIGIINAIFSVTGVAFALGEPKIAVVFSAEKKFLIDRIKEIVDGIEDSDTKMRSMSVDYPDNNPPLQAADIVAYETMLFHRKQTDRELKFKPRMAEFRKLGVPMALQWELIRTGLVHPHPQLRFEGRRWFQLNGS